MEFDLNTNKEVIALLGAGSMGTAIVKRIGAGKLIFLGDISEDNLEIRAKELRYEGYIVETQIVDAMDKSSVEAFAKKASELGTLKYFINTAGASPNQASPEHIINLDLVATSETIDVFADYIAEGGSGLIISSQTGYMMNIPPEVENEIAMAPTSELKDIDFIKNDAMVNSGVAYIVAKRANHLRVRTAAATTWGDKRARINTISPGIIVTPLAYDEFEAAGEGYQEMINSSPARRVGTPEEIARAAEFLLSDQASFITGIDLLIDGGVIAAINSGRYSLHVE
ncbi:SDR family oxidoreductase [Methanobrevibacter sp.]|uniref:SDR family oxidoreductase n=1 Tax=Methanobrevibacter sp. TaxID=66852 RepID=UPI0025F70512|nr:SDR family oxidoreductase [Methanobrevibacter sp.]MBQ6100066.1 SDR family oxidoreductase [Methanobrevibacter sp.]MBQ6511965.1 SDR family oxidoreductase [Methanobrevibacter sp.]